MDSLAMDMTRDTGAIFKLLYPTIAPQNSGFFSLIRGEKWGFDFGILTPHVSLISTHESVTSRVLQPFWCFGVCNVPLNAPGGALFPTSYGEMEVLRLAILLKIWAGLLPPNFASYIKCLKESFSLLYKSSSSLDLQTRKPLGLSNFLSLLDFSKKIP